MALNPATTAPTDAVGIRVSAARSGGWVIPVERNGQALVTEHHADWHRVERRVLVIRSSMASLLARAAATLLIALLTAASMIAQEPPPALLPEPHLITKAVERVAGFNAPETTAPRDGFYAHTGQMITGAGWISLGPGFRRHFLDDAAVVELSTARAWAIL